MAKFCKNCGKEVSGKFCEECGTQVTEETKSEQGKENASTMAVPTKKKNGCLWGIVVVLFVIAAIVAVGTKATKSPNATKSPRVTKVEKKVNKICEFTGVDKEEGEKIVSVLDECKIPDFDEIAKSNYEKNKLKLYNLYIKDKTIKLYINDLKLESIEYNNIVLYEDGQRLLTLTDITHPKDKEHMLQYSLLVDEEESKKILEILEDSGVTHITEANFEKSDGEGIDVYELPVDYGTVYITLKDKKLSDIKFEENYLYKKNKIVANVSDFVVTKKEKRNLITVYTEVVKKSLKSPSSAKFPADGKWFVWKQDGKTYIQAYVDADNSFGANLRSEFQFIIEDGKTISYIFDGKELLE